MRGLPRLLVYWTLWTFSCFTWHSYALTLGSFERPKEVVKTIQSVPEESAGMNLEGNHSKFKRRPFLVKCDFDQSFFLEAGAILKSAKYVSSVTGTLVVRPFPVFFGVRAPPA